MEIQYPAATTYWIISSGGIAVAGQTEPNQVTTTGDDWEVLLQTTDLAAWQDAVALLPPDPPIE
jgi:hypothetical protein